MRTASAVALLAAATITLAGCAGTEEATPTAEPSPTSTYTAPVVPPPIVPDYLPNLGGSLFLPEGANEAPTQVPLVVMIPGGGWLTADPTGLDGLARHLSGAGIAAMPVRIRAARDGVTYPVPVEDILCAVAYGVATASDRGVDVGTVVLLGHSSGAHLSSLAVLATDAYTAGVAETCPWAPVTPDALIGLSGPYDVTMLAEVAELLFKSLPDEDPATWEGGNPLNRAGLRPDVPVLLVHGAVDEVVPQVFTDDFAAALAAGGHDVTVKILDGLNHGDVLLPQNSGDIIADWVEALP